MLDNLARKVGEFTRPVFRPKTGADVLVDVLVEWGVDLVFGLPGDGIDGVIESFRQREKDIKFIQVRHEEAAALMACGYAKMTGKLGVCVATSGPGGIHLLNGLYDAKMDGVPVLAITGLHYHDMICTHAQQDVELDKLFENVCVYNARVMGPDHIENVSKLACQTAFVRKGVAQITIPIDFQYLPATRRFASSRNIAHHMSLNRSAGARRADTKDVVKAADLLNRSKRIAILAGQGALGARDELIQCAERLGAPIIKALLGKSCVPDDSIYTTGGIGLLGTRPSEEAIEECDTLLMVGTSFPYTEFLPKPGKVCAIQIDTDPTRIGLRHPVEVGLVGDARNCLHQLLQYLEYHKDREFLEKAQDGMKKWWKLMKDRGSRMDKPMKPQVVAWELGKRLKDDAIVCSDSGTVATWFARQIPSLKNQKHTLSGTLATMACGLPYAIGSQLAYPGREVIAFVGDGGLSMLMAELATCVKYQLPVRVIVIKNNELGQIKWEQVVLLGNPEYVCQLQPIDFVKIAEGCGAKGYRIEDPARCGEILDKALSEPGPVVVEALVDPDEPPLPAKIKPKQAAYFATALARGTRGRDKIVLTLVEDKIKELL